MQLLVRLLESLIIWDQALELLTSVEMNPKLSHTTIHQLCRLSVRFSD